MLFSSYSEDYPSEFDEYKTQFDKLNDKSICKNLKGMGSNELTTKECEDAANGM